MPLGGVTVNDTSGLKAIDHWPPFGRLIVTEPPLAGTPPGTLNLTLAFVTTPGWFVIVSHEGVGPEILPATIAFKRTVFGPSMVIPVLSLLTSVALLD